MYTENPTQDVMRFVKAVASNLVARFAPTSYVRLTAQTGRGAEEEAPAAIADYFIRCFTDYGEQLGLRDSALNGFVEGKRVLEYGPGDVLGTALLFYAHGAAHVECVDRFPLQSLTPKNAEVYRNLIDRLSGPAKERASRAFHTPGDPTSGLRTDAISYRVGRDGLCARPKAFDLIVSRAVLEHVNSLEATLTDVATCLAPGGYSVHSVDLRSHNLDRYRPFDFLTWPESLYRLMYSHKGFPNRWRTDAYRRILSATGLRMLSFKPTGHIPPSDVARIQPRLAHHLQSVDPDELSWTGFWMVLRQEATS